ncbi:MAG: hypothetical protein MSC56_09890, partial [Clostridiales bacterium]|nr:hypothetical protein [Clostridiales bacterium]
SAAACTSQKIHCALQVWNLCARSAQIMRAAGCKPSQTETQRSGFRLKACQKHFFDTLTAAQMSGGFVCIAHTRRVWYTD